jgi:hypothetical protein
LRTGPSSPLENYLPSRTALSRVEELRCVNELRFWRDLNLTGMRRSYDLLLESLSEAQRNSFLERGWFEVRGSKSKKPYRILARTVYNVQQGKSAYCVQVANRQIPFFDELLTQKMVLEFDEPRFLRTANKGPIY